MTGPGGVNVETGKPPGTCAFGYCRGTLAGRGRSPFCCDEHSRASHSRQTVEARARQAERETYERIANGQQDPHPHLGVFTATNGVVLDGAVVNELRALLLDWQKQNNAFRAHLAQHNVKEIRDALRRYDATAGNARMALLLALDQLLPTPQPPKGRPR